MNDSQKIILDPEEQKILDEYESGEYRDITGDENMERSRWQMLAKRHQQKNKNINIRVTEKVYHDLKTLSQREGLPYQSFLASVITLGIQRRKKILDLELA